MVDWRDMFKRYMRRVGEEEGVDYIIPDDWSDEEMEEIHVLDHEIFDEHKEKDNG